MWHLHTASTMVSKASAACWNELALRWRPTGAAQKITQPVREHLFQMLCRLQQRTPAQVLHINTIQSRFVWSFVALRTELSTTKWLSPPPYLAEREPTLSRKLPDCTPRSELFVALQLQSFWSTRFSNVQLLQLSQYFIQFELKHLCHTSIYEERSRH